MSDDQKDVTPRAEVLREAEKLITGDRNETYGTPTQNFDNIAKLWNVQFRHLLKDGAEFAAADVALAQIHVKMARMVAQPKRDNFVDLAGYAACGWECIPGEEEPEDEISPLTGVVPPRATGGVFTPVDPGRYAPYMVNVTTSGVHDPEEIAAMLRGAVRAQRPVRDSLDPSCCQPVEDDQHECGPCC
jgi:hypothetical protein